MVRRPFFGTMVLGVMSLGLVPQNTMAETTGDVVTYSLTPDESSLYVLVRYDRNTAIPGHDHTIVATEWSGTVEWNALDPSACNVSISLPVHGLSVDPRDSREKAGLDGTTSESNKSTIKKNFLSKSQLYGAVFSTITYQSSSCATSEDRVRTTGELTIRGISATVTADLRVTADGETFVAQGSFNAAHTDFGFEPHSALGGALKNENGIEFHLDLKGRRK